MHIARYHTDKLHARLEYEAAYLDHDSTGLASDPFPADATLTNPTRLALRGASDINPLVETYSKEDVPSSEVCRYQT